MTRKWIIVLIVGAGIYMGLSGESFIERKGMILASVSGSFGSADEIAYLKEKNQKLELEVLNLKQRNPSPPEGLIDAKVFSVYPFSGRSEMVVSVGSDDGVEVGSAVIGEGFLVGRIKEVKRDMSVVTTIFDSDFKLPVRIGESQVDALYVGGLNPRLDLIDKCAGIAGGSIAISASSEMPYGLGVARTMKVSEGVMQEADALPLFEVKDLRNVFVVAR